MELPLTLTCSRAPGNESWDIIKTTSFSQSFEDFCAGRFLYYTFKTLQFAATIRHFDKKKKKMTKRNEWCTFSSRFEVNLNIHSNTISRGTFLCFPTHFLKLRRFQSVVVIATPRFCYGFWCATSAHSCGYFHEHSRFCWSSTDLWHSQGRKVAVWFRASSDNPSRQGVVVVDV